MNFHSLDYFLVLAREKNFTRAAEALHITQQSLSSHIAGLEKELGCTLLVRRTPLELTYAGRTFLRYAESIGQTRQAMEREFCDISENQKGELRVGIAYTRARAIMPRLIPAFQRQYPNVEITLLEGSNDAIQKALLSGGIDLAIAGFPHPIPGVVLEDYYLEHIVLCLSDGLLAQCGIDLDTHRGEIAAGNLSALCDCPFVLGSAEDMGGRIGRGLLRSSGVSPVSKATSENVETLLALCEQGVKLIVELLKLVAFVFGIVHLLEDVDHLFEIFHYFEEGVETEFRMTDLHHLIQHKFLTSQRCHSIDRVESILLQDYEVDQF